MVAGIVMTSALSVHRDATTAERQGSQSDDEGAVARGPGAEPPGAGDGPLALESLGDGGRALHEDVPAGLVDVVMVDLERDVIAAVGECRNGRARLRLDVDPLLV